MVFSAANLYLFHVHQIVFRTYHPGTGFDILKVQRISQAQAWQRAGRAGREAEGNCYRTYTLNVSHEFYI